MKFPSVSRIAIQANRTLKRFPIVLFSAFIAVTCAVYLTEKSQEIDHLFNIILVSLLGIPLFTALTFISEYYEWNTIRRLITRSGGFVLLALYYFALPDNLDYAGFEHVYRYMLYVLGVHLLVAVGPYGYNNEIRAFWQYNKTIFLRFLTAVFFSGVLFIGLAIALGSIEILLEIDIEDQRYLQLFYIVGGIFNTWFFLAGMPYSIDSFSLKNDYPKGLKIFTKNILLPLVVVYLVILYVYMAKIVILWTWPEGWVANLVLSFSIVGILALLLLHPIRDEVDNKWIRKFSGSFYAALIPLTILLLLAIYRRIWDYGFTVERYFVMTLGLWLAGIVAYFLFSKKQNIKVIPGSLCIIAFLISIGPWSAFSVSERSQINRLEFYLYQNKLLQNGQVQRAASPVSFTDQSEISSIIRYLNDTHGLNGIESWFDQDLGKLEEETKADSSQQVTYHERPRYITEELIGIDYIHRGVTSPTPPDHHTFYTQRNNLLDVEGVNRIIQHLNWSAEDSLKQIALGEDETLNIQSSLSGTAIQLSLGQPNPDTLSISIDMEELISELKQRYHGSDGQIPAQELTVDRTSGSLSIRIYFERITWSTEGNQIIPESAQFDIGLK